MLSVLDLNREPDPFAVSENDLKSSARNLSPPAFQLL